MLSEAIFVLRIKCCYALCQAVSRGLISCGDTFICALLCFVSNAVMCYVSRCVVCHGVLCVKRCYVKQYRVVSNTGNVFSRGVICMLCHAILYVRVL